MAKDDEFAALTKLLDEAVLDPRLWVAVCDRLAAFLGGVGTVLVAEEPEKQGPWVVRSKSLDGLIDAVFRDGWQHRNFRRRAVPLMKRRGYATDYDIADAATMRREPFYTELLAPQKLGTFIGLGIPVGPDFYLAAIEREIGAPAPDADLIGRIERIQPMLAAAGRTSAALGRMKLDMWRDLSSDPERAIFLIDHFGRVLERNAAAEDFVGPSLHLKRQQIRLTDGAANVRFQHLIAVATAHGASEARRRHPYSAD